MVGFLSLYGSSMAKDFKVDRKYTHFAVRKSDGKIVTGWEYKGLDKESIKEYTDMDLRDMDLKPKDFSIQTKESLLKKNINPFDWSNWRDVHKEDNQMPEKKYNKFAICTASVGRENEDKYKDCKRDIENPITLDKVKEIYNELKNVGSISEGKKYSSSGDVVQKYEKEDIEYVILEQIVLYKSHGLLPEEIWEKIEDKDSEEKINQYEHGEQLLNKEVKILDPLRRTQEEAIILGFIETPRGLDFITSDESFELNEHQIKMLSVGKDVKLKTGVIITLKEVKSKSPEFVKSKILPVRYEYGSIVDKDGKRIIEANRDTSKTSLSPPERDELLKYIVKLLNK